MTHLVKCNHAVKFQLRQKVKFGGGAIIYYVCAMLKEHSEVITIPEHSDLSDEPRDEEVTAQLIQYSAKEVREATYGLSKDNLISIGAFVQVYNGMLRYSPWLLRCSKRYVHASKVFTCSIPHNSLVRTGYHFFPFLLFVMKSKCSPTMMHSVTELA